MSASVLFDEPGPRTRLRHRVYGLIFLIVIAGTLYWMYTRLDAAGQFDQRVFDGLSQSNVWSAINDGIVATLRAAGIAIVLSVILGFLLAVGRLSEHAWLRIPCRLVIEFFRAVPVLLLMIFLFALLGGHGLQTQTRGLMAVVGGLMLYNGAVLAEVFRAGVQAVPKGQSEAAYAIGMRKTQVMTSILTPQAVRFMLPAIISQCVVVLKDTSLGFIAAYTELLREGKLIAEFVHNNLMTYLLIAVIYIAMNSIVSAIASWLEWRLSKRGRTTSQAIAAVEDVLPVG